MPADTLPELYRPLMQGVTVKSPYCLVCGRTSPLNQHHVVKRSAGKLFRHGKEIEKPTLTLCGSGTTGCHGLAHEYKLHFRWVPTEEKIEEAYGYTLYGGHWEFLATEEPTDYQTALGMEGWMRLDYRNRYCE